MTKHEFIQEAALRLIGARPSEQMSEIHRLAKKLADLIYPDDEEVSSDPVRPAPTVSDLSEEPIDNLLAEVISVEHERVENKIQRHGCHFQVGGVNVRVYNVVRGYDICTVSGLLKNGRVWFAKQRGIGPICVELVDKALENLYGIKSW